MKTAIDIVLEAVSSGSITREDAKILLEAINEVQIVTVTVPYKETITTKPDWTTTGTDSTPPVTS